MMLFKKESEKLMGTTVRRRDTQTMYMGTVYIAWVTEKRDGISN